MKKFHLSAGKSPTHANLVRFLSEQGWQACNDFALSTVNESWLDFSTELSETLEYKHTLASFLKNHQLEYMMPETFFINDQQWPYVLNEMAYLMPEHTAWILKPSLLNNGQHIHLFPNLLAVKAHMSTNKRMGGPQVLQRYISKPQLLQGPKAGHKFSIRQLLVLSTHAGCALFPNGYFNIALNPYQEHQFNPLGSHLTNEYLNGTQVNVIQRLSDEMIIFKTYKKEIITFCQQIIKALQQQFPSIWQENKPRIACFGVDFIADQDNRLWLLEVNHGPCFPTHESHPLFNSLYRPFWQNLIKRFIDSKPADFITL
ncbi:MAG: tubulin-tyrosine ligase [bacterium]|nr:tubulin-tyrosine ligase [bacterium]